MDIRAAKPLLPEVRHVYMGERLDTSFAAMGLLVRGSPLGRTMGNVYLKIARPGIPTRIFALEPKALAWLRGRKKVARRARRQRRQAPPARHHRARSKR